MSNWNYYLSLDQWKRSLTIKTLSKYLLSSLGTLWLITEITAFFFSAEAGGWIASKWWLFLLVGLGMAIYSSKPKDSYKYRLNGRDVVIEIRVADAFRIPGSLIIPTNKLFDKSLNGRIPKAPSLQGAFIRKHYEGDVTHLNLDVERQLEKEGYEYTSLTHEEIGGVKEYKIGATIQLERKGEHFYLLALTHINDKGLAYCTNEDLQTALAELWYYISEKGKKCDIVIPLIGTGYARLSQTRDEVTRTIIRSFVASCASKNYCDKLTIALYPKDVTQYDINIQELGAFLKHVCIYTEFAERDSNSQQEQPSIANTLEIGERHYYHMRGIYSEGSHYEDESTEIASSPRDDELYTEE